MAAPKPSLPDDHARPVGRPAPAILAPRVAAPGGVGSGGLAPGAMPAEGTQAERHRSARVARASILIEDYVELIDDLIATGGEARPTDIARRMGVSHATAIAAIARAKAAGLATSRPYRGVFLTEAGRDLAARVRARHRLVVDLLVAVGVPPAVAETDAEGIEHHVSDVALSAFERFLKGRG